MTLSQRIRGAATALAIAALTAFQPAAAAEGNYPFVEIYDADKKLLQGPVATNVVPLWPIRSCFGWVLTLPTYAFQTVEVVEIQKLPGPSRFAGDGFEVHETLDGTTAKQRLTVGADGRIVSTWCVNDADPPGEYRFDVHIDGRHAAEFRYCGIRVPENEPFDLEKLACPRRHEGS